MSNTKKAIVTFYNIPKGAAVVSGATLHLLAERCASAEAERDELRQQLDRMRAACETRDGKWIWSDDDANDLEGMSDQMIVTMTARQLRQLLKDTP